MRLRVQFPSGKGFKFLAEVRQHTWSSGTNVVVAATFSLRLKGKPVSYVVPLAFVKNLEKTLTVKYRCAADNVSQCQRGNAAL